jgi:hypothetical protein
MKFKIPKYTTSDGRRLDCDTVFFQRETGERNHAIRKNRLTIVMIVDWTVPGVELTEKNIRRHPNSINQHITPDQLTPDELAEWRSWKIKRDIEHFVGGDIASHRAAAKELVANLKKAATAIKKNLVRPTKEEAFEIWSALDLLSDALESAKVGLLDLPKELQQECRYGFKNDYLPITDFSIDKIEKVGTETHRQYQKELSKYRMKHQIYDFQ